MNDNNGELRELIKIYCLTGRQVATYCLVSENTTRSWTVKQDSTRSRRMPDGMLLLLRFQIQKHRLKAKN